MSPKDIKAQSTNAKQRYSLLTLCDLCHKRLNPVYRLKIRGRKKTKNTYIQCKRKSIETNTVLLQKPATKRKALWVRQSLLMLIYFRRFNQILTVMMLDLMQNAQTQTHRHQYHATLITQQQQQPSNGLCIVFWCCIITLSAQSQESHFSHTIIMR